MSLPNFSKELDEIAEQNQFYYIYAKAEMYLKMGPDAYRKGDFFQMPDIDLPQDLLDLIEIGCKQILEGKGLTKDNPFTGLGISGFYRLFELFHFDRLSRNSYYLEKEENGGIIDEITFQHVMNKNEGTYYNLVTPLD